MLGLTYHYMRPSTLQLRRVKLYESNLQRKQRTKEQEYTCRIQTKETHSAYKRDMDKDSVVESVFIGSLVSGRDMLEYLSRFNSTLSLSS